MAILRFNEQKVLERIFEMEDGYVLDFSNGSFQDFIQDAIGVDIYTPEYEYKSCSKANLLRGIWRNGTRYQAITVTEKLLEYWRNMRPSFMEYDDYNLYEECKEILSQLRQNAPVENIEVFQPNKEDKGFSILSKSIRESIEKNQPEVALDRLHTFVVKYVRELCDKRGIEYTKDTPLHSLFGGYVKHLTKNKIVESEMSIRILKSAISILEAFNKVRNNKSFAHDNPILNYDESLLIFKNISSLIAFISSIEKKLTLVMEEPESTLTTEDELPF